MPALQTSRRKNAPATDWSHRGRPPGRRNAKTWRRIGIESTTIAIMTDHALPIDAILPELRQVLGARQAAVLVAPPGAGKTTRVPLVLADESWASDKKILVLEPRRLAARAAADRMARTLGEPVGET